MTIPVSCDACGKSYSIADDKAGRRFRCKACGESITVPELEYEDEWDDEEYEDDEYDDGDEWGQGDEYEDDLNPYAAPSARSNKGRSKKRSGGNKAAAKSRLIGPAICLYVVAGLSSLNHAGGVILAATGNAVVMPGQNFGRAGGREAEIGRLVGGVVGGVVGLIIDIIVIMGAYNMQKLKSH